MIKLRIHCKRSTFFYVDVDSFNKVYHFIFVSYLVDYHMFLLTNFSGIT